MIKLLLSLMLFCCAFCAQGRSISLALKQVGNASFDKSEKNGPDSLQKTAAYGRASFKGSGTGYRPKHIASGIPRSRKISLPYDVTLETGSYFFDSVYKFKVPATRHFSLGLNGGYSYYDKCVHGYGKWGSLGLVGGVSLMMPAAFKTTSNALIKRGALRLNADIISYPYRKVAAGEGLKPALLDRYTRELSTRIYLDAKIVWRSKRGALITRCMIGITAGSEQLGVVLPIFVGAGVGYRLR